MKKIIIVGLGEDFVKFYSKRFPFGCFEIVSVTDFDNSVSKNADLINMDFTVVEQAVEKKFDYIIISDQKNYQVYREKLANDYNVKGEKILDVNEIAGFTVDKDFQYHEFHFSFGELNPEKTFYIIRPTYSIGLFACVGRTMAEFVYAENNGWIPIVDMQNYPNMYLSKEHLYKENAWEYFFKQVSDYSLDEVYSSKNVVLGDVRNGRKLISWSQGDNVYKSSLWNRVIKINESVSRNLETDYKRLFEKTKKTKVLGVLLRGTDYVSLQPDKHPIQPSAAEMIKMVTEKQKDWNFEYIYLSTEDEEILQVFQKTFGTRLLYTNQIRYKNTGKKFLASIKTDREDDEIKRGEEYLITIMLLSRCDYLISSICGGSNVVKMINGEKYIKQITINKGLYGVDDEIKTVFDAKNIVLIGGDEGTKKTLASKIYEKYHKPVYICSENKKSDANFLYVSNFLDVPKSFCVIAENSINKMTVIAKELKDNNCSYSHIDFMLKNEVNVAILKAMGITEYLDEQNNKIMLGNTTSDKIVIRYHNAINSHIAIEDVRVSKRLQVDIYGNNGRIKIGKKTSIYDGVMQVTTNGSIEIGEMCLLSDSIGLYQNDNHLIFDKVTGKRINQNKNIQIGNHVWVGNEVVLLAGAVIPDNCIIGSRTVTSRAFDEKNAVIAGQPAKIIRKNVVWARDEQTLDYDEFWLCNDKAALLYMDDEC